MSATLPAPSTNLTAAGMRDRGVDVLTASTLKIATGDYTGGAHEDLFTLSAHGFKTGDILHVLWQSAMGAVTGGVGRRCLVKYLTSSTFQLTDLDGNVIENTADGTVHFLLGNVDDSLVDVAILPNYLVCDGDYTGGTAENMFTSASCGIAGMQDGDGLTLLYKSASGVLTGKTAGNAVFAKAPTVVLFQVAGTNGGAAITNSADGTAVFLKTS